MAMDLSKIKGISDEVKAKLAKVTNKDEFDALVKAENLSAEQLNELSGGGKAQLELVHLVPALARVSSVSL